MLNNRNITIVGAGIGGLAASIALAQRGASVQILEQADAIREVGAGLQISPNGAAVLRALGVEGALKAVAVRGMAVSLREGARGDEVFGLDLTRHGPDQPYYFLHRADLIDILAKAARAAGVKVRLLQHVTGIETGEDGTVLTLGHGAEIRPDILIGADGARSVIRPVLDGVRTPFFTGQAAWRAVVPATGPVATVATVYMGAGRHLVTYPLRSGAEINIVAVEERGIWTGESWSTRDAPDNLRAAFSDFCPTVQDLLGRVENVHLWGLFRHPVAQTWHQGRVAILGDAAHPTLPFLAQGATMALEDAWVLADSLAADASVESALARYQTRRHARAERVIDAASKNARNYHLHPGPARFAAHGLLRVAGAVAPGLALKKFDWLYRHDVTRTPH